MSIAEDGVHAEGGAQANGCGLGDNLAVQAARADWLHHSRRFQVGCPGPASNLEPSAERPAMASKMPLQADFTLASVCITTSAMMLTTSA